MFQSVSFLISLKFRSTLFSSLQLILWPCLPSKIFFQGSLRSQKDNLHKSSVYPFSDPDRLFGSPDAKAKWEKDYTSTTTIRGRYIHNPANLPTLLTFVHFGLGSFLRFGQNVYEHAVGLLLIFSNLSFSLNSDDESELHSFVLGVLIHLALIDVLNLLNESDHVFLTTSDVITMFSYSENKFFFHLRHFHSWYEG